MHFYWGKRLALTRDVLVALQNQGMPLALMNIALTMLAVDLLAHESRASALPMSWS